jgi:signal transduction histidine kinase
MEHLYRVVAKLYAVTEVDELERLALKAAMDVVDAEAGSLVMLDKNEKLAFVQAFGPAGDVLKSLTFSPEEGVAGAVFRSGVPVIENDTERSTLHLRSVDQATSYHTRSLLTVPLRVHHGDSIGVLQLLNKRSGPFDENDLSQAELIGSLIALTLHNAQLASDSKLAAVANVAGEVSHDIGNLLTHILPFVQTLKFVIDDVEEGKPGAVENLVSFYSEVVTSVEQGVTQIMTLTREIAAAVHGEITPLELKLAKPFEVLQQVAESLQCPASKAGVHVFVTGDETLESYHDPFRLRTAVYNSANNGLQATPEGGSITLTVCADEDPEYYTIKIADTGAGMSEQQARRLFSDKNRSTKQGGTGLGGRIVRRVAEQHGGCPSVVSVIGEGTTIILRLPRKPAGADEALECED